MRVSCIDPSGKGTYSIILNRQEILNLWVIGGYNGVVYTALTDYFKKCPLSKSVGMIQPSCLKDLSGNLGKMYHKIRPLFKDYKD